MSVFVFLLITVAILHQVFSSTPVVENYRLTDIKYADLLTMEREVVVQVVQALTEQGALQITGIPRFGLARKRALEDLADCLEQEESVVEAMMPDGARRLSCGAMSTGFQGDKSLPKMSSVCGEASGRLRALIDAGLRQLFLAMDTYVETQNDLKIEEPLMQPSYHKFGDLLTYGAHLEHLHAYFAPTASAPASSLSSTAATASTAEPAVLVKETMATHVDAGLFIGMTAGYYSSQPVGDEAGLYLQVADQPGKTRLVKAEVSEDALIVLVGNGANQWLAPILGQTLRPMPHALVAGLSPSLTQTDTHTAESEKVMTRSWFGKMILPPPDALVSSQTQTQTQTQTRTMMTFAEFQQQQRRTSVSQTDYNALLKNTHSSNNNKDNAQHQQPSGQMLLPLACDPQLRLSSHDDDNSNRNIRHNPQLQKSQPQSQPPSQPQSAAVVRSSNSYSYTAEEVLSVVATDCEANQLWCWAQCMPVPASASNCASDQYLACYDYQSHTVVSGDGHCMGGDDDTTGGIYCRPTCVTNTSATTDGSHTTQFCIGRGTTMFMQGFTQQRTSLSGESSASDPAVDCVTLLFTPWVLDSRLKFALACLSVFLLAAITQTVPVMRRAIVSGVTDTQMRDLLLTVLFGVDKTLGYFVMLVAMTYSTELFIMICLGVTAGFVVFHLWRGEPDEAKWGDVCCDEDEVWNHKNHNNKRRANSSSNSNGLSINTGSLSAASREKGAAEMHQRLLGHAHPPSPSANPHALHTHNSNNNSNNAQAHHTAAAAAAPGSCCAGTTEDF